MATEMTELRVLADFVSDALRFQLLDPTKVVAWADAMIAEADAPPPWMLDLSLANPNDPESLRAALDSVPGTPDRGRSVRLLSALVLRQWREGRLTFDGLRGIGWELLHRSDTAPGVRDWGVWIEAVGEEYDSHLITGQELDRWIESELREFEDDLTRIPSWI
jgi:hypothetical protein